MPDPLSLPNIGWASFDLVPINTRETSAMEGRRTESVDGLTPFWRLTAETQPMMDDDQVDDLDAFLSEADAGGAVFLAHDVYRPRPRAYGDTPLSGTRAGGGAFDGTATLATRTSSTEVVIEGLPEGFIINRGCNIGFRRSALVRSLHRVIAIATADAEGVATVQFRNPLDALLVPEGTSVDLEKPSVVMSLDRGWSLPKAWSARRASFTATEVFFSPPAEPEE